MKKGSKIYSLEAISQDPLATRNTILFAALTCLGIPPEVDLCGEFVEEVGGRPRSVTVWRLAEKSRDGKYATGDMIRLWEDKDFVTRQPEHPLAYIKQAFENHTRAIEFLKDQGPIVMKRRGRKIGFVSRFTTPEFRQHIIDELNAA